MENLNKIIQNIRSNSEQSDDLGLNDTLLNIDGLVEKRRLHNWRKNMMMSSFALVASALAVFYFADKTVDNNTINNTTQIIQEKKDEVVESIKNTIETLDKSDATEKEDKQNNSDAISTKVETPLQKDLASIIDKKPQEAVHNVKDACQTKAITTKTIELSAKEAEELGIIETTEGLKLFVHQKTFAPMKVEFCNSCVNKVNYVNAEKPAVTTVEPKLVTDKHGNKILSLFSEGNTNIIVSEMNDGSNRSYSDTREVLDENSDKSSKMKVKKVTLYNHKYDENGNAVKYRTESDNKDVVTNFPINEMSEEIKVESKSDVDVNIRTTNETNEETEYILENDDHFVSVVVGNEGVLKVNAGPKLSFNNVKKVFSAIGNKLFGDGESKDAAFETIKVTTKINPDNFKSFTSQEEFFKNEKFLEKLRNENIVLNNKMLEAIKNNQILIAYQDTILNNYEKLSQEELLQGYNSGYAKSGDLSIFVSNKFAKQKSEERIKREESNAQTSSPKLKVELVGKSLKLEIDNGNKYTTTTTFDVDETVTGSLVGSYVGMIPNVDLKELPVANYKLFTNRKYNISNAEIENQINKFAKNILKEHPELKPQFDREFEAKLREIEEDVLDIANEEEEKFNNDKELAKQSFLQKRAEEIERFNKSKIDMINNQKSSNIEKTTIININSDKDGISDVIENNKRVVIVNNASINTSAIDVNKALAKINLDSIINAAQEQVKNANIQVQKANFDNYRKDIEKYKGNLKQYFDMNNINMDFDITVDTASCFPNEASNGKTEKEVRVFKFSNGSNTFAMPNIPNMPVIPAIPNIPTINIPIINLKPLDLNKMLAIKVIKGQDEYIFWYENSSEVLDKLPKDKIEDLSKELEILNNSKSVCEADIDKNKAILDVWKGCSANLNEMKVYPNPAVNQFNIDFTSSKVANCNIYIADLTGKNLQTLNGSYSTTVGMNSLNFNVNNLTSGMYYVIIESEFGDIIQQRLIIK